MNNNNNFRKTSITLVRGLLATATLMTAFIGSTFAAQKPPPGFNICNEAGEMISVAFSYYKDQQWISEGWWNVNSRDCKQIHNSLENTRFYLYAKGESGKVWGANHPLCINPNKSFQFLRADDPENCKTQVNFFSVWVPDPVTGEFPPYYTYTFGSNTVNLNNPRAER